MKVQVGPPGFLLGDVGVDLRGGDAAVAEQVLYHAQVGIAFQHMASKAVPQGMGVDAFLQPGARCISAHDFLNAAPREPSAVPIHEQRLVPGHAARQMRAPVVKVVVQRFRRRFAVQRPALLVAFAPNQNFPTLPVHVAQVHALNFRKANPGGVEDFQNGPIPEASGSVVVRGIQQPFRLFLSQKAGQLLFHLDRERAGGWHGAGLEPAFLHQEIVEGSQGGQLTHDADAGVALGLAGVVGAAGRGQVRYVPPQELPVHFGQLAVHLAAVGQERVQVVQVDAARVGGQ